MTVKNENPVKFEIGEPSLEGDPRWQAAEKAARSSTLSRASHLRAIFLFVVRYTILHPEEPIHEFEIAHRVLGRRSDFNPLEDNIVRVQMGHLRKKLDLYFSTEGKNENLVISIALGSYKPTFSNRSECDPAPQTISETVTSSRENLLDPIENTAGDPAKPAIGKRFSDGPVRVVWIVAACLATLVLGMVAGFYFRSAGRSDRQYAEISNPILSQIFARDAVVNVVVADTSLVFLQNTIHSDISVADYLDPKYPDNILAAGTKDPVLRSALNSLTQSRFTSLDDADVVSDCFKWGTILGAKTYVRYARYMHVRDFDQGNFIIVGSRRGNPWTALFERNLNFYFEEDPATHTFHFRNRHPIAGESPIYTLSSENGGGFVGYVDIAFLPNLARTGSVLLLNGFSMATNEAAANLIFTKDLQPRLSKALAHLSSSSKVEILLRVRDVDRAEFGWEIVSIRTNDT